MKKIILIIAIILLISCGKQEEGLNVVGSYTISNMDYVIVEYKNGQVLLINLTLDSNYNEYLKNINNKYNLGVEKYEWRHR